MSACYLCNCHVFFLLFIIDVLISMITWSEDPFVYNTDKSISSETADDVINVQKGPV